MSKRDQLLNKDQPDETEAYELNEDEQQQLAALLELVNQSRMAQDIIFTRLVHDVAARYEISGAAININMDDVQREGVGVAKLVVTR